MKMNGINILNKTAIMEYTCAQHIFFAVLLIAWCVSAILVIIGHICDSRWSTIIGGILFLITCIVIGAADLEKYKNTGRYKTEETIDEQVPFIEVYEKYDEIKKKGNIWVLKDKEVKK